MKIIGIYIMLMGSGILLGYKWKGISSGSKARGYAQNACLFTILFLLGHQLGSDETVRASAGTMGLTGLLLCLAAMAGSFALTALFRVALDKFYVRGKKEAKK